MNCQAYRELLKYSLFNEKSFFNIKGDSFNVQPKIFQISHLQFKQGKQQNTILRKFVFIWFSTWVKDEINMYN